MGLMWTDTPPTREVIQLYSGVRVMFREKCSECLHHPSHPQHSFVNWTCRKIVQYLLLCAFNSQTLRLRMKEFQNSFVCRSPTRYFNGQIWRVIRWPLFQSLADSSHRCIIEKHVQWTQSLMHLAESAAPLAAVCCTLQLFPHSQNKF